MQATLIRDWIWILVTAYGVYKQLQVAYEAYQDVAWVINDGHNGGLLRDARASFKDSLILLSMQILGLLTGMARLSYPGSPTAGVRATLALGLIISWSLLLIWLSKRALARRRDLYLEVRGRHAGHVKTRSTDTHDGTNRRTDSGSPNERSGGVHDHLGGGPRRTD